MKANIKKTIFKEDTNICAWIQQYDDNGNYDEFCVEELKPKDIPKEVVESFEEHHKVVIFIAPGVKVGVFAKNWQDIKEYLDNHYQEKISLDELASLFYINKFYLTRVFKEQYGLSIYSYLQQIKITHAKQLLRFTDDTLESISLACNMGDPTYFSRTFKKIEGISPGEFRKRWQEAN
jgi:AraC-like DNA-binding protein